MVCILSTWKKLCSQNKPKHKNQTSMGYDKKIASKSNDPIKHLTHNNNKITKKKTKET